MYNYGFNPYQPYQAQPYQQPQQIPPTQVSGTSGNTDNRIWVQGRGAAEAHLMTPNSFVRLWDNDGKTFYEKTTDASGRPSMRVYQYSEIAPKTVENCQEQQLYTDQIESLEKRIRALEEEIHATNSKSYADDTAVQSVPAELPRKPAGRSHEADKQRKD